MLKILFIGDIVGKLGRRAVVKILPQLKKQYQPDLVIANAENLAHGKGLSEATLQEMMAAGIDWFTNGDHAFSGGKSEAVYDRQLPLLRPANFPEGVPGRGFAVIKTGQGKILLVNLIGRVFMKLDYDCPFRRLDQILTNFATVKLSAIIVDIHAEATSEKVALSHYVDGRVSALLGSHTHIMTADHKISPGGTAYITDVGMSGLADGVLGVDKADIIKTFLTQIKYPHLLPEQGRTVFNAVLITVNPQNSQASAIKPIIKFVNIK